jgi:tRNA-dihydrouridine synthase
MNEFDIQLIFICTEFVSSDGLLYSEESKKRLLIDLQYHISEKPIIAQLFGSDPHKMRDCTRVVYELGFDGYYINHIISY